MLRFDAEALPAALSHAQRAALVGGATPGRGVWEGSAEDIEAKRAERAKRQAALSRGFSG